MCGIVGYLGKRDASDILLDGLKRLEYRGYDSAGICTVSTDGELSRVRNVGNLDELAKVLNHENPGGTVGIGHNRWATHGAPTEANAHPHLDCSGRIAVVHNGIIDNFVELRAELESEGHVFTSETDTEVAVHLIEREYRENEDLADAVAKALKRVVGSFALAVIHRDHPDLLVAARRTSPMVLGIGDGEYFIGSVVPAFLSETKNVLFVENDELLKIDRGGYTLTTLDGEPVSRQLVEIEWDLETAEKEGYEHFMLKEIHDQPKAVSDTLRDKFNPGNRVSFEQMSLTTEQALGLRRIVIIACGTAYHSGILAKYLFERWVSVPAEVEIASEFRYRNLVVNNEDLVVAVSQSGETADTLAGVREAVRRGAKVIAITNNVGSQITRESDGVIYTHAGPEIGVAATKTFATQMIAMYLLALYLGRLRGSISEEKHATVTAALKEMPEMIREVLSSSGAVVDCASKYYDRKDFLFLGRSVGFPVALEGALKLKEVSYIHAEGYPAGELKHGPIALIDENVPLVVIVPRDSVYDKVVGNIREFRARGAKIIAIATRGDEEIEGLVDDVIWVPEVSEMLYPLVTVVPLQLLAYNIARLRDLNVDQPRNLAKTVTVE